MRRTSSAAPTGRDGSRRGTTRISSWSARPTGATSPTTSRATWSTPCSSAESRSRWARLVDVPSRKQRRRRLKERRHEYEYVYVDEEGREVEAPEEEQALAPPRGKSASGRRAGSATTTRAGRRIEPPSWRRVGKRGLFIAPVMFLLIGLMGRNLSVAQRVYETVVLL